jgi:hypothetical protein
LSQGAADIAIRDPEREAHMHLLGHLRDRFSELIDEACETDRFPATVGYMQRYRPKTVSTGRFLRLFAGCDDIMPRALREAVGELYRREFGADLKPQHLMAYRNTARRLEELRLGRSRLVLL